MWTPGINIGDTAITAGKHYINDTSTGGVTESGANAANYNVYYDSSNNTLTLRNAKITKNSSQKLSNDNDELIDKLIYHAFYTDGGTLTIKLDGNNEFTGANLTSEGNARTSCGVLFNKTDVTITGTGHLTVMGGDSRGSIDIIPESYGLYVMDSDLTIDCTGDLTLMGGPAAGNSARSAGIRINSKLEENLFKMISGEIICGVKNDATDECYEGYGISSYCNGNGIINFEMQGGSIATKLEGIYSYTYGISLASNDSCNAKIYGGIINGVYYARKGDYRQEGGNVTVISGKTNSSNGFYCQKRWFVFNKRRHFNSTKPRLVCEQYK